MEISFCEWSMSFTNYLGYLELAPLIIILI